MNAADILSDDFPHGTVTGFADGCRTNHCPSPISCAVFDRRYRGDWGFRKRVDAGATVADLVAHDEAEVNEVKAARVRAREAEAAKRYRKKKPKSDRKTTPGASHHAWTEEQVARLRELHALGWSDGRVGADPIIGRNLQSVWLKRKSLGLPANRRTYQKPRPEPKHGNIHGYFRGGCRDDDACPALPTCGQVGRQYLTDRRRRLKEEAAA